MKVHFVLVPLLHGNSFIGSDIPSLVCCVRMLLKKPECQYT